MFSFGGESKKFTQGSIGKIPWKPGELCYSISEVNLLWRYELY